MTKFEIGANLTALEIDLGLIKQLVVSDAEPLTDHALRLICDRMVKVGRGFEETALSLINHVADQLRLKKNEPGILLLTSEVCKILAEIGVQAPPASPDEMPH